MAKKAHVIKEELLELCQARRQALEDLEKHKNKANPSGILAEKYEQEIIRGLEREISDKLDHWISAENLLAAKNFKRG